MKTNMNVVRNGMLAITVLALTAGCSFGTGADMSPDAEMFGPAGEEEMTAKAPVEEPVSEYDARIRFVHRLPGADLLSVSAEIEEDMSVQLFHRVGQGQASQYLDVLPEIKQLVVNSASLEGSLVFDLPGLKAGEITTLVLQSDQDGFPRLLVQ